MSTDEALLLERLNRCPDESISGQLVSIEHRIEEATAALFEIDENAKELQLDPFFEDGDEQASRHALEVARNVLVTMRVLRSIKASVSILRDVTGAKTVPSAPSMKG
ncbi:MAG: hypothetical protein U0165_03490 [Polyangiaceae bacterium]